MVHQELTRNVHPKWSRQSVLKIEELPAPAREENEGKAEPGMSTGKTLTYRKASMLMSNVSLVPENNTISGMIYYLKGMSQVQFQRRQFVISVVTKVRDLIITISISFP